MSKRIILELVYIPEQDQEQQDRDQDKEINNRDNYPER